MTDEHRKRIEEVLDKHSDIIMAEDGYYVYWPDTVVGRGCCASHDLRVIADILDERNEEWDAQVKQHLAALKNPGG